MKVAINQCYGGFSISYRALDEILTRKGIKFDRVHFGNGRHFSYYTQGCEHTDANYIRHNHLLLGADRTDPILIEVIEELGEDANGHLAHIVIMDIPDSTEWHIVNDDGMEHVVAGVKSCPLDTI